MEKKENNKKAESNSSKDWEDPNFVPPEGGENMVTRVRYLEEGEQPFTGGNPVNAQQTKYRGPVRLQSPWQNETSIDRLQLDPSKGTTSSNTQGKPNGTQNQTSAAKGNSNTNSGGDDIPTMTYDQVKEFGQTGTNHGKSPDQSNIGPGGVSLNVQPTTKLHGVYRGRPEVMEYDKILRAMRPIETEEQRKEREKRERRDALFSAIGDGVSALSNLYFTTKGSPSADQSKSLSKAQMETVEKERKEREANMAKRLKYLQQQREAELALREQDRKDAAAEDLNSYRKSLTMMHQAKLANDQQYKTWYRQFKNEQAEAEKKYKDRILELEGELNDAKINNYNARAGKYASGGSGGSSRSSSGGGRHHRRGRGGNTHRGNTRSNNRRNTRPQRRASNLGTNNWGL